MIKIVAVGKIKEKYFKDAISEYVKRLSPYTKLEINSSEKMKKIKKNFDEIIDKNMETMYNNTCYKKKLSTSHLIFVEKG